MKTRYWVMILAAVLILCGIGSAFLLFPAGKATYAEILSDGKPVKTVDLRVDQEFTVTNGSGYNVITVRDGAIAVTGASCPDHYCMHRGFCSSGLQIVCLPNALVIRFMDGQEVDSVVG